MVKFKPGPEEADEIFSETARKLPVQLNRKQYENLFESFDYTKEATVDVDGDGSGRMKGARSSPETEKETESLKERGNNGPSSDLQSGSHFYFQIKLFSPFRVRLMLFKLQALLIGVLLP